jgi:transcriptional regulator with XRE-family HTH domain
MTGKEIQLARLEKGIKQIALAAETGIQRSRLSMIENGWVTPNDDEQAALRKALDLKPEAAESASEDSSWLRLFDKSCASDA